MQFKKVTIIKKPQTAIKRRRFYTKKEREAIIQQWESSTLSQVEFCAQHKLSPKSFYRWRCQYSTLHKEQTPVLLKEVDKKNKEVEENKAASEEENFKLECYFPNGVKLLFRNELSGLGLSSLLKEIMQCKFN